MKYYFPLNVGDAWFYSGYPIDTVRVLSSETILVPAGSFKSFKILRKYRGTPDESGIDTIWMTPYIGIIKLRKNEIHNGGPPRGDGLWELKEYSLH